MRVLLAWLCLASMLSTTAFAAPPTQGSTAARTSIQQEEAEIPKKTTRPPMLSQTPPPEIFTCKRTFLYKGEELGCDSNLHQDGERLRPILRSVPGAVSELDEYQAGRRSVEKLAYVGTIGIFSAAAGILISRQMTGSQAVTVRNIAGFGGLALAGGALFYGLSVLSANEAHLTRAVDNYNKARPDAPIVLQFSSGF